MMALAHPQWERIGISGRKENTFARFDEAFDQIVQYRCFLTRNHGDNAGLQGFGLDHPQPSMVASFTRGQH
jgi:hypothetical protein